jgi:hypothetical protein
MPAPLAGSPLLAAIAAGAIATAAAAAIAPAAHADTHSEVTLGATGRALRSSSANAVTGADLTGGALGVARDLGDDLGLTPVLGLPGLGLWAEAGLVGGAARGTMFQSLSTQIDSLAITGGLAARYRLHRLVTAAARIAAGAQRIELDLAGGSDHAWGAVAAAGVSVDVFAFSLRRFGLGARLEAGYLAAAGVALTPHTDRSDDAIALSMNQLSIGHLDLSGPTASLSVLGQF